MQPYVNPQFFGSPSYQQYMQTPIYQQINQPMASTIRGKVVSSVEDIMVNDVPMDGSQAVFVKSDMSEIYTRGWRSDGTIVSHVYRPVEPPKMDEANNVPHTDINTIYEAINDRLDRIDKRLEELGNESKHTTTSSNGKRKSTDSTGLEVNATEQ